MNTIEDYLFEVNPWWRDSFFSKNLLGKKRETYLKTIFKQIDQPTILALTGLRRVGKSTLLFQTIDELLKTTPKENILYFKIDDLPNNVSIKDIIETYENLFGISIKDNNTYIFIDEIQNLQNWSSTLKFYIDYKYTAKFIVSGSSRALIYKDSRESLLGRITFIDIFPLTFREFLEFKNKPINLPTITSLEELFSLPLKELYYKIQKSQFHINLEEYFEVGAYPEWFLINDKSVWRKKLVEENYNLLLYKDIVNQFNIRNPRVLDRLTKEIATLSSSRISFSKIAQTLDETRQLTKEYISYLEDSQIILCSEKYTKNKLPNERANKKLFFWEEGLRRAITKDSNVGISAENVFNWHLYKLGKKQDSTFELFYFHDTYEVDCIYSIYTTTIPIEIKYSNLPKSFEGLKLFEEKYKSDKAIVVTKNTFEIKENWYFLPLWFILLFIE